jgi:hypothetical protein
LPVRDVRFGSELRALFLSLHIVGLMAWLGTAAADIILELVLMRTRNPDAQRAFISLHRWVDISIEGPGILLAVVGGVGTLAQTGFLQSGVSWPTWLVWKVICGSMAAVANLVCVVFVLARWRACCRTPENAAPLADARVRFWSRCVLSTGVAVPAAFVALVLGLTYAR